MTTTDPATDADLLAAFAGTRSEAAFVELVRRHGPLVRGVCRRVLGDDPDADDAFQAVFLVLARKAGRLRDPGRLGPFLYGVAVKSAGKAKAARLRRQRRERPMGEVPAPERESDWADVRPVLDAELGRLPAKLRDALVLCELQGVGRDEAAGRLGVPAGTLSSRLARAKDALRARLTRRGLVVSASGLATVLTTASAPAAVPSELILNTAAVAAAPTPEGWVMGKVMAWMWLALTGGLAAGAVALAAGLSRSDLDALQGEWALESSFNEFDPAGCAPPAFGRSFVIAGDVLVPDPKTAGGRLAVRLDPWKSPRQIDLKAVGVRDLFDGQVVRGLYAVSGDTLTLNVAVVDGQPRPTHVDGVELYSRAGKPARMGDPKEASRLFVLKRVKK